MIRSMVILWHVYATVSLIFWFPNRAFRLDLSKHICQCSWILKHHVCAFIMLLKPYTMFCGAGYHLGITPPLFWGLFKFGWRTCSLSLQKLLHLAILASIWPMIEGFVLVAIGCKHGKVDNFWSLLRFKWKWSKSIY